jgi:hypothetical protein
MGDETTTRLLRKGMTEKEETDTIRELTEMNSALAKENARLLERIKAAKTTNDNLRSRFNGLHESSRLAIDQRDGEIARLKNALRARGTKANRDETSSAINRARERFAGGKGKR